MKDEKYMCAQAGIIKKDKRYFTRKSQTFYDLREAIVQSAVDIYKDYGIEEIQAQKLVENYEFILPFLSALKLISRRKIEKMMISEK